MNNESIKLCECGCGQPAPIAKYTWAERGWIKGQPKRFVSGHNTPKPMPIDEANVPPKYCECGCGGITSIATENDASSGKVRGQRMRFVPCHHPQRSLREIFETNAMPGQAGECWEWQGYISTSGYGAVLYKDKQLYAHRVSFEMNFGPIPDGMFVCHHCDNKKCWNPAHLFLGTPKDNVDDMMRKGRHASSRAVNRLEPEGAR